MRVDRSGPWPVAERVWEADHGSRGSAVGGGLGRHGSGRPRVEALPDDGNPETRPCVPQSPYICTDLGSVYLPAAPHMANGRIMTENH